MSTVRVNVRGDVAIITADPNYAPEDWDRTVRELVATGYVPLDYDPVVVYEDGLEKHVWHKASLAAEHEASDLAAGLAAAEVLR